jgi:hypothetical protein
MTVAQTYNDTAGSSAIVEGTLEEVTFSGNGSFIIPNGALAVSDILDFSIRPQSMITVTIYLADGQQTNSITSHPGSRTTSWFTFGDHVNGNNSTDSTSQSAAHW